MRPTASPASGSPTLVASKLAPPPTGQVSVRPGLLEMVTEGARRRLLVVSAPAGYGKSTVIAEATQRLGLTTAWYKLDVLDHDPIVFVASLTEAIRRHVEGFGEVVRERLGDTGEIPITVPELLALFVHELEDEVKLTLHLVLDDYQEVAASAELNKALDFLLANLPPQARVIVLTRFEPLFSIAKLRLDDELAEIGYEQLRLDAEQIISVFKSRAGVELPTSSATRLEELTEGWPVSVVLAAKALQSGGLPAIEVALGDPRLKNDVFSYLAEQVIRREDDETRAFLKRTSCLEYITPGLADEITGLDNGERLLEHLEKNQVFTFADARRTAFRYHPLFRDYLRQKCAQQDGARKFHDLQLKAAAVMERAGDTAVAVEIYLSANEPRLALDCLARADELALESCTLDGMTSWLARLPSDLKRRNAWALLLEGQIDLRQGRFDEAIDLFRVAESSFVEAGDKLGRFQAISATESTLFWKGDTVSAAAECRRAIDCAPNSAKRAHSLISLGAALMDEARWRECESLWSHAEDLLGGEAPAESARVRTMRAYASFLQGNFKRADDDGRPLLHHLRAEGPRILEAAFLNILGNIEMHLGRYRDAEELMQESMAVLHRYGLQHLEHMTADSLGQVLAAKGDLSGGLGLLDSAFNAPLAAEDRFLRSLILSHMGTAHRRTDELQRAGELYRQSIDMVSERLPYAYFTSLANLSFVQGLLRDTDSALKELCAIRARAQAHRLGFIQLKCDFFLAILRYRCGQHETARIELAEVVEKQLQLGHVHFVSQELVGEPEPCLDLMREPSLSHRESLFDAVAIHPKALPLMVESLAVSPETASLALDSARRHMSSEHLAVLVRKAARSHFAAVRRVAGSMASDSGAEASESSLVGQLTKRESEVLSMMARGMRNDEIAKALFVAPSTVKTHVNRIFVKLGVSDRVQAVLRYRASVADQT